MRDIGNTSDTGLGHLAAERRDFEFPVPPTALEAEEEPMEAELPVVDEGTMALLRSVLATAIRADEIETVVQFYNNLVPGSQDVFVEMLQYACEATSLLEPLQQGDLSPYSCLLLLIAGYGATLIGRWLIVSKGANIHIRDGHGNAPLFNALTNKHPLFVKLLLEANKQLGSPPFSEYLDGHDLWQINQVLDAMEDGHAMRQLLQSHDIDV